MAMMCRPYVFTTHMFMKFLKHEAVYFIGCIISKRTWYNHNIDFEVFITLQEFLQIKISLHTHDYICSAAAEFHQIILLTLVVQNVVQKT